MAFTSPSLSWSADPVAFYHALHPQPALVGVDGQLTPDAQAGRGRRRNHDNIGSFDNPSCLIGSGVLDSLDHEAVWWTIHGLERLPGRVLRVRRKSYPGLYSLTAKVRHSQRATLSACWLDLDLKAGSPLRDMFAPDGTTDYGAFIPFALGRMSEAGWPAPSLLVRSGVGLWLLWLLRTSDGETALPATPSAIEAYNRLQQALVSSWAGVEADDTNSTNARALMRVPGSRHRNGQIVSWAWGHGDVYTLNDLEAVASGTEPRRPVVPLPRGPGIGDVHPPSLDDAPVVVSKRRGRRTVDERILSHLYAWARERGGIVEGGRYHALDVAAYALRRIYFDVLTVDLLVAVLRRVNRDICTPPQDDAEVIDLAHAHVARALQPYKSQHTTGHGLADLLLPTTMPPWPYERIRRQLRISADYAAQLGIFLSERPAFPKEKRGVRAREHGLLDAWYEGLLRHTGGERLDDTEVARRLEAAGLRRGNGEPFTRKQVGASRKRVLAPKPGGVAAIAT